jgi:hypothetical protein
MKKISSLFIMMLLLVGTLGLVAAVDDDTVVPEPKRVGWFENFGDRLGLVFTFNKENRIERILDMAEKRLAEAEVLAEEDPKAYQIAQERYDNLVAEAEEIVADIESEAGDATDSVENMERVARIQNQFERHRDHADEIYARARERFQANNASQEKIERFEMFHERAIERSNEMEERILERKEDVLRKHRDLSEMGEDELEELLERVENDEGLTEAREKRMEQFEVRTNNLEEKGIEQVERIRARIENSDLNEEQRVRLETRLQSGEAQFQNRLEQLQDATERRIQLREETVGANVKRLADAIEDELNTRQDLPNYTGFVAGSNLTNDGLNLTGITNLG